MHAASFLSVFLRTVQEGVCHVETDPLCSKDPVHHANHHTPLPLIINHYQIQIQAKPSAKSAKIAEATSSSWGPSPCARTALCSPAPPMRPGPPLPRPGSPRTRGPALAAPAVFLTAVLCAVTPLRCRVMCCFAALFLFGGMML